MSQNKHRVSVGLPVYNGEKYLEQAIVSVLDQTYQDFELIISDNASTDRTQEICQVYAAQDNRIRYYRNERNLGAAPNFNRVFELASGEYFKWIASDDAMAPEFISKCIKVLDENPLVVLCFPKVRIIDESGNFIGDHNYKADTSSTKPHIRFRNLIMTPDDAWEVFGLARTEILKKTALHASYPASDLVLLAELALYGQFFEIPEYLLYPRYHADQSINLIPVERDRVIFYDTSLQGRILLPKWQYLQGYLKAIEKATLDRYGKLYCLLQVLRWIFKPDHFRALGKDILLAGRQFFRRWIIMSKTVDKAS